MPSGAATDALGVIRVLLLFAPVVLAVAVYGLLVGRRPERGPTPTPHPPPPLD